MLGSKRFNLILASLFSVSIALSSVHGAGGKKKGGGKKSAPTKLFNGKNLEGWKTEGNWMAGDKGVLTLKPRPGEKGWRRYNHYLYTGKKYKNFILSLEYKHPKDGNSGIHFRIGGKKDPVNTGIEMQILDSYGKKGKLTHHDCGGIIKTTPPLKNMAKPAGEWNKVVLECQGSKVRAFLNGELIVETDLSKSEMKDRLMEGYIALQDHGQPIWFRNISIKELK